MTHQLTSNQVAALALHVGLTPQQAQIAVAVAAAESHLDADAHYVTKEEDSKGLWQINTMAHGQYLHQNLYDPLTNAQAMADISAHGTNFMPWSTFKNGLYLESMPRAIVAVGAPDNAILQNPGALPSNLDPGTAVAQGPQDLIAGNLGQLTHALGQLVSWVSNPANWLHVLEVIGGGVLVVGALMHVVQQNPQIRKAAMSAAKVAAL